MSSRSWDRWETYSLRVVIDWLIERGLRYEYRDNDCYHHAVNVWLNGGIFMDIQTHPRNCERAFAETAINHRDRGALIKIPGYEDMVLQHWRPEDLFIHICEMLAYTQGARVTHFESGETRITFWNGRSSVFDPNAF